MAKAFGNKVSENWDALIGQVIEWAIAQSNRTHKEVWVDMHYETGAQLAQWISGERPANFARLFSLDYLRIHLVIGLASLVEGVTTETTIRIERRIG